MTGALAALLLAAASARAVPPPGEIPAGINFLSATFEQESAAPAPVAGPKKKRPALHVDESGWMVMGGWFFKDALFNGDGRGGLHVNAGKTFPVVRWLGLWVGGGFLAANGSQDLVAGDGTAYASAFHEQVAHADLGIVTPLAPFPVSISGYWSRTTLDDVALGGAVPGDRYAGEGSWFGVAFTVQVLFDQFLTGRQAHRGLGLVIGYMGFLDVTPHNILTTDAAGRGLLHPAWKPLAGEGLRAGLEYEF